MAKDTKPKPVSVTSPRGVFVFPKLSEPDYGTKEYPKPDGEYSVKLRLKVDDPATEAFIKKLQPHYDAAIAEAEAEFKKLKVETRKKLGEVKPNELYTTLYDQETEEPTGEIEFKFKMTASGETKKGPRAGKKWTRKPDLFDARMKPIPAGVNIWGGSQGKVSALLSPYFIPGTAAAGLSLKLAGVQVIELVSNGSRSASSYGFEEEDGYETSEEDVQDRDTSDDGDTSSDDSTSSTTTGEEDF